MVSVLCSLGGCGLGGGSPEVKLTVAAFGDSTTYGTPSYIAAPPSGGWNGERLAVPYPERMTLIGDVVATNYGINGMSANNLISGGYDPYSSGSSLPPFVSMPLTEQVIVFGFGLLESIVLLPASTYKSHMEFLIQHAQSLGKVVVLKNPSPIEAGVHQISPPAAATTTFTQAQVDRAAEIRSVNYELGKQYGIVVVPIEQLPYTMSIDLWDRVHPNQDFSNRIAEMTHLYIRRAAGQ